jgi:hypothetical protein
MKLKPKKLNAKALGGLLGKNGEKIVFGLIVVGCVAMIVFTRGQAVKNPPSNAKDLQDAVEKAKKVVGDTTDATAIQYINSQTWWSAANYEKRANDSNKPIDVKYFEYSVYWDPLIIEQLEKRREPPLLPIEDMRAVADRDGFPKSAGSTDVFKGQRWVMLTGAIPIKKETEAYRQTFSRAQLPDPANDIPKYEGFEIKRLEVPNRWAVEQIDWYSVSGAFTMKSKDIIAKAGALGTPMPEPDPSVTNTSITFPLPPRAHSAWGQGAFHDKVMGPSFDQVRQNPRAHKGKKVSWTGEPETGISSDEDHIAVFTLSEAAAAGAAETTGTGEKKRFAVKFPTADTLKQFTNSTAKIKAVVDGGEVVIDNNDRVRVKTASDRGVAANTWPLLRYEPPQSRAAGADASTPDGESTAAPKPNVIAGPMMEEPPEYLLFRALDFSAQPGKYYRYAVRLELKNPNFKKPEQYLESSDVGQSEKIYSPWVELSQPFFVPEDTRLVANSVSLPSVSRRAPVIDPFMMSANVEVFFYDTKDGANGGRKAKTNKPIQRKRGELVNGVPCLYLNGGKEATDLVDTNVFIVDMRAERIDDRTTTLGAVLVLNPNGVLEVRESYDGRREAEQFQTGDAGGDVAPAGGAKPKHKSGEGGDQAGALDFGKR